MKGFCSRHQGIAAMQVRHGETKLHPVAVSPAAMPAFAASSGANRDEKDNEKEKCLMKVSHKKIDEGKIRIEAVATPQEVDEAFQLAHMAFAQQMGLRPDKDKTPAQVAEEKLGIKDLDSVVVAQVPELLIPFALDKKDTVPAYPPQILTQTTLARGEEFQFTLDVEPKPEYELSSYGPVSFTIAPLAVDDREIEAQLAQMADSYAEYVSDDPRPVASGDSVELAIEAFEDGKRMEGLSTEGRTYTTGMGYMPEEFDKQVIGMEVGETKKFSFAGPSFDAEGNDVEQVIECTVTVKEMQKRIIPAITDAWVKKNMPLFANVEMLKNAMRSQIMGSRSQEYETYKRQLAVTELAKRFEGKIGDPVYEAMRANLLNNLRAQLEQQNIKFEQFIEQNGGEQQFGMMLMLQTRQNLIEGYSLDALFRHEKMTLTEEDIMEACKTMNPQQPQWVRSQMEKTGCGFALRETASRIKANRWLVEHADITVEGQK
ncbi:MAG: hypothetical protein LBG81_08520 [Coriobacteriaceae bacterium]|jgi:trigger factor|nr:hypothetical protein [Coriobacteriaceae bacterium]